LLARLHRFRNRVPIADTILQLLEATRAHAGIAIWPNGEQALANVLRMVDLARRFEVGGASSFRGFVERLRDQAERNEAADAPVLEDGSEGGRLMTLHQAKGLEVPVGVAAAPDRPPHRQPLAPPRPRAGSVRGAPLRLHPRRAARARGRGD